MPHKHTRRERDLSSYDLPPTQFARPLPVTKSSWKQTSQASAKPEKAGDAKAARGTKRKRETGVSGKGGDTPRAFRRLMAVANGKRVRSGLDDGIAPKKGGKKGKGKKEETAEAESAARVAAPAAIPAVPAILPGERLSDYSARVDAALPLAGLIGKGGAKADPLGIVKTYRTHKERKMHKLYAEWHKEEEKIKEKEAEAQDEAEEREMELDDALGVKWRVDLQTKKKKKRKGGGDNGGGGDDDEGDMWAALSRKRAASASAPAVRAGVHGVVDAPPELTRINTKKFFKTLKAKGGLTGKTSAAITGDLPRSAAAGTLAEREALQAARQDVLAAYRRNAANRRQKAAESED